MKVLSLFDGISCGMVALERAGIPVERYVAYEIEEDAIKVAKHNYPMIEEMGDVFEANYEEGKFDLLIGGSPCTYWSIAKASDGRETTSSGFGWELFMQYVRALKQVKPTYFLYENNESMSDGIKEEITKQLGVDPIMIDSADFSAQIRKRYYWTNIPVDTNFPKSDLIFKDILFEHDYKTRDFSKYADTVKWNEEHTVCSYDTSGKGFYSQANRSRVVDVKMNTLTSSGNDNNRVFVGGYQSRQLHPVEAERMQTLPDGYTSILKSDTKRRVVCGNGWTVDVIAHILKGIKEKENKQMELKMNEYQLPEQILFNYEELKKELTEKVSMYETLVYTDDQIKLAKDDRANLNKLKKALNDERIRREKEYMVPFNDFKTKINKIISIIDKPVAVIDKQVKAYEDKQKQEKLDAITLFFNGTEHPHWLHLSQIMDSKWMNASVSMKSVQEAINARLDQIEIDLTTLHDLPEFGFESTQVYISTLDMNKALYEGHRMSEIAKAKAEAAATEEQLPGQMEFKDEKSFEECINPPVEDIGKSFIEDVEKVKDLLDEPAKQWIAFQALLSTEDAFALRDFFNSRNIEFKAV